MADDPTPALPQRLTGSQERCCGLLGPEHECRDLAAFVACLRTCEALHVLVERLAAEDRTSRD